MTNREQIEQGIIGARVYTGNETVELLNELDSVYKKANTFDEVKNNIKEELDSYSVLYKETQDPRYSLLSGVYENIFNYIEELEREEWWVSG